MRPVSQLPLAVVLLALAACAPATTPATQSPAIAAASGSTGARGVGIELTTRVEGVDASFPVGPDEVFAAVRDAYAALSIPLSRDEPAQRTIGNDGLRARRVIGKLETRRLFDCGGTAGAPNAETYQLTVTIISSVRSDGGTGSVLTTVVDGSGINPNFASSGAVRCSSTSSLEDAIAKDVRTRLQARR